MAIDKMQHNALPISEICAQCELRECLDEDYCVFLTFPWPTTLSPEAFIIKRLYYNRDALPELAASAVKNFLDDSNEWHENHLIFLKALVKVLEEEA